MSTQSRSGIAVVAVLLGVIGCVKPVIIAPTGEGGSYAKVAKTEVGFTTRSAMPANSTEVAYVFAQGQSLQQAMDLAKEKAGDAGGTLIINGRVSTQTLLTGFILFIPIYEQFYYAEGIVVRSTHQ